MSTAVMERSTVPSVVEGAAEGELIRQRREALGWSIGALADRAGVDRGRLSAIEKGAKHRGTTAAAILRALDELEAELSGPYDDDRHMVTFRMSGNFGVDVTVSGPVENLPELEESVGRLLQRMRNGDSENS